MEFDFELVFTSLPQMLRALRVTLAVTAGGFVVAVVVGALMAMGRRSHLIPARALSFLWVNLFRGSALYVLVIWLFNGLAVATGILLPALVVGVLALALLNSAYLAEVFRSGLDAVNKEQWEAAQALGLGRWDVFRRVVAPQATRIALPAVGNHLIDALKDSAILAVIAVPELMFTTNRIAQSTFRPFELYLTAALIYLVLVNLIAGFMRLLERRLGLEEATTRGGSSLR
jgi:His/Glu/Gln/Arg/opine family amino acid ABC transporter permease subunit